MSTRTRNRQTDTVKNEPLTQPSPIESTSPDDTSATDAFINAFVDACKNENGDTFAVRLAYAALPTDRTERGRIHAAAMRAAIKNGVDDVRLATVTDESTQPVTSDPAVTLATQYAAISSVTTSLIDSVGVDSPTWKRAMKLVDQISDEPAVVTLSARMLDTLTRKSSGTRSRRLNNGVEYGQGAAGHVAAWLVANPVTRGQFVTYSEIAGHRDGVCEIEASPYFGRPNPSAGAIANYLTGANNDLQNGGVFVGPDGKQSGWIGQNQPRGLVGATVAQGNNAGLAFTNEQEKRREARRVQREQVTA